MAKGDMPNASVGVGYQPSGGGTMGGFAGGGSQLGNPGSMMGRMPPMQPPAGGSMGFAPGPMNGNQMGMGVGPSPLMFQQLLSRLFGGGHMGTQMPPGAGSMIAQPLQQPVAGPRFVGGSTYNRPSGERNRL